MTTFLKVRCLCVVALLVCSSSSYTRGSALTEALPERAPSDLAVVVGPDTPVSKLSLVQLRQVFRGEQQYWSKDLPIVLLIPRIGLREREVTLRLLYRMNETQYQQYWIARVFRAEAVAVPKVVDSNRVANDLLDLVPGCIAVMNARDVRAGMKVVPIDGHLPGEPGYPVR